MTKVWRAGRFKFEFTVVRPEIVDELITKNKEMLCHERVLHDDIRKWKRDCLRNETKCDLTVKKFLTVR